MCTDGWERMTGLVDETGPLGLRLRPVLVVPLLVRKEKDDEAR